MAELPSQNFVADEEGVLHDAEMMQMADPIIELEEAVAYLVEVDTTNALKDAFSVDDADRPTGLRYYSCEGGKIWVVTNYPSQIFDWFGDAIRSIERLGPAYHLD